MSLETIASSPCSRLSTSTAPQLHPMPLWHPSFRDPEVQLFARRIGVPCLAGTKAALPLVPGRTRKIDERLARRDAQQDELIARLASELRAPAADLPDRVAALVQERRKLERDVADLRRKLATSGGGASGPSAKDISGVRFLGQVMDGLPPKELKPMAEKLRREIGAAGVVALVAVNDGKASLVVAATPEAASRADSAASSTARAVSFRYHRTISWAPKRSGWRA